MIETVGNEMISTIVGEVSSGTMASVRGALYRIAEFAQLPGNWDGEGAVTPSAAAVGQACCLIETVAERRDHATGRRVAPWTSAPIADGGLQVEWLGNHARIDVVIAPDGTLGYMIKRGSGATAEYQESDDIDLTPLLELIDEVLRS